MSVKPEWPRLLYHKKMAPGGWRIESEAERAALAPGWTDAPEVQTHKKLDPPQVEAPSASVIPHGWAEPAPAVGPSDEKPLPKRRGRKPRSQGCEK